MLGKIEHRRKRGRQRMRQLDGITDSMDMSLTTKLVLCAWIFAFAVLSAWKSLLTDLLHPVKHHLPKGHSSFKDLLDAPLYWVLGLFLKQSIIRG